MSMSPHICVWPDTCRDTLTPDRRSDPSECPLQLRTGVDVQWPNCLAVTIARSCKHRVFTWPEFAAKPPGDGIELRRDRRAWCGNDDRLAMELQVASTGRDHEAQNLIGFQIRPRWQRQSPQGFVLALCGSGIRSGTFSHGRRDPDEYRRHALLGGPACAVALASVLSTSWTLSTGVMCADSDSDSGESESVVTFVQRASCPSCSLEIEQALARAELVLTRGAGAGACCAC